MVAQSLQSAVEPAASLCRADEYQRRGLPKRSGEYLFEIIMRRHELKSTLMTSNRPLEDWGKLIGDVPAATAILDRFLQAAEVVEITGRSFRLKNGGRSDDDQKKKRKKPDASDSHPPEEEDVCHPSTALANPVGATSCTQADDCA